MKAVVMSGGVRALGLAVLMAGLLSGCGGGGGSSSTVAQSGAPGGTQAYTISGDLTGLASGTSLVLQDNGGDDLTLTHDGSFTFAGNVPSGQTYAITVLNQPMRQICLTFGAGAATANVANVAVVCTAGPEYAYVANLNGGTLSQYTIGADGSLTPMATPSVATGSGPYSVTVDPTGRYAYVANIGGKTVSQYTIGADGSLTPMATPSVTTGSNPVSVTVDPTGKYVYVTNIASNTVPQYGIGADGSLTPLATPSVAAGSGPRSITIAQP